MSLNLSRGCQTASFQTLKKKKKSSTAFCALSPRLKYTNLKGQNPSPQICYQALAVSLWKLLAVKNLNSDYSVWSDDKNEFIDVSWLSKVAMSVCQYFFDWTFHRYIFISSISGVTTCFIGNNISVNINWTILSSQIKKKKKARGSSSLCSRWKNVEVWWYLFYLWDTRFLVVINRSKNVIRGRMRAN